LSEAVAETVTEGPETVAPEAGAVMETVGGVVSEGGGGGGGEEARGTIPQSGVSSNPLLATVDQLLALVSRVQAADAPEAP